MRLWEPQAVRADPLLIVELCWEGFTNPADPGSAFHEHALRLGHRIASIDVPQEGARVDAHGAAIAGINAALAAGLEYPPAAGSDVFLTGGVRLWRLRFRLFKHSALN